MENKKTRPPLPILIIGWFGVILSATYLLYGIIGTVLTILDRTYKDIDRNIVMIMYGIPILVVSMGFKDLQKWGWYGLLIVMGLVILWSAFHLSDVYESIWGALALLAVLGILTPSVRKHYFQT
jgi:hypothetical protein